MLYNWADPTSPTSGKLSAPITPGMKTSVKTSCHGSFTVALRGRCDQLFPCRQARIVSSSGWTPSSLITLFMLEARTARLTSVLTFMGWPARFIGALPGSAVNNEVLVGRAGLWTWQPTRLSAAEPSRRMAMRPAQLLAVLLRSDQSQKLCGDRRRQQRRHLPRPVVKRIGFDDIGTGHGNAP